MTTPEKIALVERYILDRKGIHVTINTPDHPQRAYLLEVATQIALHWYDIREI